MIYKLLFKFLFVLFSHCLPSCNLIKVILCLCYWPFTSHFLEHQHYECAFRLWCFFVTWSYKHQRHLKNFYKHVTKEKLTSILWLLYWTLMGLTFWCCFTSTSMQLLSCNSRHNICQFYFFYCTQQKSSKYFRLWVFYLFSSKLDKIKRKILPKLLSTLDYIN